MGDGNEIGDLTLDVLDPAPVGVSVTSGPEHRLRYTNAAYRAIFGDRPLGVPLREAFRGVLETAYFDLLDGVLATGKPITMDAVAARVTLPETGTRRLYLSFSASRVIGRGEPKVVIMVADVTEQVTAAQRIRDTSEERRRILRRFQSLVRVSAQIVWVTGPMGGVTEPSPGWERVTGQSWEEFRGEGWQAVVHPEDRPGVVESWQRALREVRPWHCVYRLRTVSGEYRHFEVNAAPVVEGGVVIEWVGTCSDIERRWQEERRRELLDRAAAATADNTGLREMLGALAEVIVPDLADGCGVHLLCDLPDRPEGAPFTAERVATAAGPRFPRLPASGVERYPASGGFARAVRLRKPLQRTFPQGRPPAEVLPAGTTAWLKAAGANSVVLRPVVVDGTVAAVVTTATCDPRPPMSPEDIQLIGEMFEHAHDALSSALQYQRSQQVALALQRSLLVDPPEVPGLEIEARYRPSPAAADVGGDWYDAFVLADDATVLVIGDVAGHDLRAAVAMSQLRNLLRGLTVDRPEPPGHVLRRMNTAMETLYGEGTATCVLARVESSGPEEWELRYAVAGHPPPLLVTPGGRGRFLDEAANPLLGLLFDQPYVSAIEPLPPGGTVLLYTDGLVERPDEHLDQGLTRLRNHAAALAGEPLPVFCDRLLDILPTTGKDDICLIALRVPGP
ncbi:SpoIIE family protein phosphatase [Bailinhaonella thermotolerans]|uniref:protein-serine/threonine phosphatase n=1 Tax=Bailinhaonella thermotolerans TaxID=1070861 RepID=A0A3A4AMD7_9ACTN|nr:SpoIIE family protein phosphatase [Bailinhaonella thermotolerans]RJL30121.1 PAS domain S-box protein [Bailinhaonella thermotolerans]